MIAEAPTHFASAKVSFSQSMSATFSWRALGRIAAVTDALPVGVAEAVTGAPDVEGRCGVRKFGPWPRSGRSGGRNRLYAPHSIPDERTRAVAFACLSEASIGSLVFD
jgi:hypothetical protein